MLYPARCKYMDIQQPERIHSIYPFFPRDTGRDERLLHPILLHWRLHGSRDLHYGTLHGFICHGPSGHLCHGGGCSSNGWHLPGACLLGGDYVPWHSWWGRHSTVHPPIYQEKMKNAFVDYHFCDLMVVSYDLMGLIHLLKMNTICDFGSEVWVDGRLAIGDSVYGLHHGGQLAWQLPHLQHGSLSHPPAGLSTSGVH